MLYCHQAQIPKITTIAGYDYAICKIRAPKSTWNFNKTDSAR